MANSAIRIAALQHGVRLWELASALGITDSSLSRRLRKELPQEETKRMLEVIDELAGRGTR